MTLGLTSRMRYSGHALSGIRGLFNKPLLTICKNKKKSFLVSLSVKLKILLKMALYDEMSLKTVAVN